MSEECVYRPNSKKEVLDILAKAPHTVLKVEMPGCEHCEAIQPKLDNACQTINANGLKVPFVACSIGTREAPNKWCMDIFNEATSGLPNDKKGFPLIVGVSRGGNVKKPAWRIVGSNEEQLAVYVSKINAHFNQPKEGEQSSENEMQESANSQEPQESKPRQLQQNRAPLYQYLGKVISEPSPNRLLEMKSRGENQGYRIDPLCVGGSSCSETEFKRKWKNFLLERF